MNGLLNDNELVMINAYAIPGLKRALIMDMEQDIICKIANHFKVPKGKIMSRFRGTSEVVYARDWIIWFILKQTRKSLKEIGKVMNRDHTTIMWSREKVRNFLYQKDNPEYQRFNNDYLVLLKIVNMANNELTNKNYTHEQ